jgi:hypothetical protein
MARIGDYINPALNQYDPSPYLQAQQRATSVIGGSIASGIGAVGDAIKDRKQKKDTVKTSKELAKAMATLYPESAGALEPVIAQLDDEELPLSERAALGARIGQFIDLGREQTQVALQERQMRLQESQFEIDKAEADARARMVADELDKRDQSEKLMAQNKEFLARPMLENALAATIRAEQSGESPLVSSERLKTAFLFKEPQRQIEAAMAALQGLPQREKEQINFNTPITIDGQPATAATAYDPNTGRMRIIPIQGETVQTDLSASLPEPLAPYASAFEAAGAKYGVDPKVLAAISMHETANGTSPAFRNKNNAMGISDASGPVAMDSVEASIDRMARLLGSTQSGPYKNAATVGEVAGIYAPKGAENDPRNLNQYWTGGVSANLRKLGGDPSAPIRITSGAVKTTGAQTPAQARKEELEIQKMEAEAAAAEKKSKEDAAAAVANLKKLRSVANRYTRIDPKTGNRVPLGNLEDITGPFAKVGEFVDKYADPESLAAKKELQRFVEVDLLEATKDLKPVSEDEMKLLMDRRPQIDSPAAVWAQYMDEVIKFIESKSPGAAASATAAPTTPTQGLLRDVRAHKAKLQGQ